MSDLIARVDDGGCVVFDDPLDDSGGNPVFIQRASTYCLDDILGLLRDLGFNVDNQVPQDYFE